ncbi:MAG: YqeG family HAD IIIA-type phosphatase [Clostridia bacterium]|nr:YqeG family HAD IIIA-type phosphatase [Clostridia bacterium]
MAKIALDELKKRDIQYILLDLDNTLIDYQRNLSEATIEWVKNAKEAGFAVYILSNTNKIDKVSTAASILGVEYISSARKPFPKGFKEAIRRFQVVPEKTAMVGDQVLTDVVGANGMHMVSVYVDPISKKEHLYTSWKRPLEAWILKKYE